MAVVIMWFPLLFLENATPLMAWLSLSDPQHPRAKGNIKWYEDLLAEEGVRKTEFRKNLPAIVNRRPESVLGNKERTIYEALCRGEVPVVGFLKKKYYRMLKI